MIFYLFLTGNMYILSHDTNIDTHDCVALLPDGKICYYYFFNYYYYSSRSNRVVAIVVVAVVVALVDYSSSSRVPG